MKFSRQWSWPQGALRRVDNVLDWFLLLASDLKRSTLALEDVLGFGLEFGLIFALHVKSLALHVPWLQACVTVVSKLAVLVLKSLHIILHCYHCQLVDRWLALQKAFSTLGPVSPWWQPLYNSKTMFVEQFTLSVALRYCTNWISEKSFILRVCNRGVLLSFCSTALCRNVYTQSLTYSVELPVIVHALLNTQTTR